MSVFLLAIDIGTSGCRVTLFRENGEEIGTETENYHLYTPKPGLVEQDPEEWWAAVCNSCKKLINRTKVLAGEIAAVGIDGQSWSAIPVDPEGRVLGRTPIWMDVRADAVCRKYQKRIGSDRIFRIAGNPLSPSYTLPKILYFMEQEPELIRKTDKFLQSNSFIVYRMTGVISQDLSQSYAYHNFDQHKLTYDEGLTKEFGIPKRFLLDMVPSDTIVGNVTKEASARLGILEGTPVVAGGLDAACSSLGVGVIEDGQVQEQGGQAGGMSICTGNALAHPSLILSPHVVRGKWLLQGGTVAGGASMNWFANQFGARDGKGISIEKQDLFQKISEEAEKSTAGAGGIVFLPYMNGERSPIWDSEATGTYFGFGLRSRREDFVRATMEGVAFSLRHNLELARMAGAEVREMFSTGGSAQSSVWMQIKADVTNTPICVPRTMTSAAWGAAILAGVGSGVFKSEGDALRRSVVMGKRYIPDFEQTAVYNRYFEIYKDLYVQTKSSMHTLSAMIKDNTEG